MKLPPEFVEMCVGIGGFMVLGGWLGYKLRKLVERHQRRRTGRISKRDLKVAYGHDVIVGIKQAAPMEFLPMERRKRSAKPSPPPAINGAQVLTPVDSEARTEVIAALTGCGYSKALASKAADACALAERTDLASWIRAALRNASGGAS